MFLDWGMAEGTGSVGSGLCEGAGIKAYYKGPEKDTSGGAAVELIRRSSPVAYTGLLRKRQKSAVHPSES